MTSEFVVLGDTHLERLSNLFPNKDWMDWSLRPFYQVENYCLANGIKHVIQTGDLFDAAVPDQATIVALIEFLDKSKLEWHFSLGNHDIESQKKHSLILLKYFSIKKKLKNCFFYPKATAVKINGVRVVFLPYPKTKNKLLNKQPSLIIAHVERAGSKYDSGRAVTTHDFDLGDHYWVIGHLHTYQHGERYVFPGAPAQLRHGDGEDRFFLHLKIQANKAKIRVKYSKQRIATPYVLRDATINKLEDLEKTFSSLKENVYLRLFINSEIAVPQEWISHPQVLKHRFFGDKKDIRAMKEEIFDLKTTQINTQSRMAALQDWFRNKSKLSTKRQRRAIKLAKREEKLFVSKIKKT